MSDGWHTQRDLDLLKATRVHLGVDFMYRRPRAGKADAWKKGEAPRALEFSRHYDCPNGTPCLAVADGVVVVADLVRRGHYLMIDHGGGFATQYMHLASLAVKVGDRVLAGHQVGVVGHDIAGYKLNHLHFQCRRGFKTVKLSGVRINPEPLIKTWKILDRPL